MSKILVPFSSHFDSFSELNVDVAVDFSSLGKYAM